ncbi:transposase [Glaesserella parasuis]|nr:transposase [Glaesserella parasuis]
MSNYRRNFTQGGIYFFTIVLQDRTSDLLVRYIDEFRCAYKETVEKYSFETIAITILPDHLHLILQLPENDDDYSIRLKFLKTRFTQKIPKEHRNPNFSREKRNEAGIWQRRFWEHYIRDEEDLEKYIAYTYYNPVKHNYVKNVSDWAYSSFHKDVQNGKFPMDWGSDVKNDMLSLYQWDM